MLIRIVITNFRSYRQETEFNMLPSSNVRRKDWHVHSQDRGANVLRTAVVYGANGAGKSCLIKALGRLQAMVAAGSLPPTEMLTSIMIQTCLLPLKWNSVQNQTNILTG